MFRRLVVTFAVMAIFGFVHAAAAQEVLVSVSRAADDEESAAGIVIAGTEQVLAKFRFTAQNGDVTIGRLLLAVTPNTYTFLTSAAVDEVPIVKLYDGATQIGAASGYPVVASGAFAGFAFVQDLRWNISQDVSKTLTVRGVLNTIAAGADSGSSVYVHLLNEEFEALGKAITITSLHGSPVWGREKVVYKTKPTITLPTQPGDKIGAGEVRVLRFRVAADASGDLAWKKFQLRVSTTGATMVAADSSPGTTGNVKVRELTFGNFNLDIAEAYSGSSPFSRTNETIPRGNTGYVTLILGNEEKIAAGTYKDYEVSLTFFNLDPVPGQAYATVHLHQSELMPVGPGFRFVEVASESSFVWSDLSDVRHSEETRDWANGWGIEGLPSDYITVHNGGGSPLNQLPPAPPQVWEEVIDLAGGEWTFFSPVGIVDSPFEMPVYSWDAARQSYVPGYRGGAVAAFVITDERIRVSARERQTETLALLPEWNFVGFTRFPTNSEFVTFPAWEVLSAALNQGIHALQIAVWSQDEDRYLRVGITRSGDGGFSFWYDGPSRSWDFVLGPGRAFFIYCVEGGSFNPNTAFAASGKGAPALNLAPLGASDGDVAAPPPVPSRISPRGKSHITWGALKRQ